MRDARILVGLARSYAALVALTAGQIVLGALVRAHGAGLACPDWPLCFGKLVPQMNFQVAFEYGHRLAAGSVSLLFLAISGVCLAYPPARRTTARWTAVGAGLLALQVVLGGLTVLHLLAAWTVTAHLVTGNAFAATLLVLQQRLAEAARATKGGRREGAALARRDLCAATAAAGALVFAQIVLGGLVSSHYAGLACPDWPACANGVFFPSFEGAQGLHLAHRMNGYLVLVAVAVCAWLARGEPLLASKTRLALGLVALQVGLGIANVRLGLPVEVTALHSAGATGLVLLWTAIVCRAFLRGASTARHAADVELFAQAHS